MMDPSPYDHTEMDEGEIYDACATCGEIIRPNQAQAEVVRDEVHVLVHADSCMREGEEIA